ncbi:MAG: HAMP domain-containing sensor histidine kinase [Bacteroidota bacterium]
MKRSITILLLSVVSIIIVIGIEVMLVTRIYRLETEKFDYRYRGILQKGLVFIEKQNLGLSETYKIMNILSGEYVKFFKYMSADTKADTLMFRQKALEQFQKTLVKNQELDEYLIQYLKKLEEETEFKSYFRITFLSFNINDYESFPVYNDMVDLKWTLKDTLGIPEDLLPVYHYSYSGNKFDIGFDYFVDFSNKKALVFRQIGGSLALAVVALLAVVFMVFYTLRNLMEERRLSELKTDFINNMTHELKTPLSTISVATRTLENDVILDSREKIKETVAIIHRQNRQLTKQINHLLEISMWEKRQFSLERQMLEVKPFFSGIAEAFRWECKERNCILEERYSIKTSTAYMDEIQMTIALHNLLVNAVKYNSDEPHILLEVCCDDRLKIAVTDNGIGISREDQKHIFDKFYRVHTGNIHKVKGLGLGLFYVQQIVSAHGGSIEVSSRPGKGSTFTINLPVHGKN